METLTADSLSNVCYILFYHAGQALGLLESVQFKLVLIWDSK